MEKSACSNCGKDCIKHAKGMCTTCYKKLFWKPKSQKCKRCGRNLPHHAKGYCAGCYNSIFHLQETKDYNNQKRHKISSELYNQITQKCILCGFNQFVELHHIDCNRHNNSKENMVGLCPNHHKMIHTLKWREEVLTQIMKALHEKELSKTIKETEAQIDESQASPPKFNIINKK